MINYHLCHQAIERLVGHFPGKNIYLVGGALRDAKMGVQYRDLDFVIDVPLEEFRSFEPHAKRNGFGGVRTHIGDLEGEHALMDVWALEDTYCIREFEMEPTIESLLLSTPFNLDKIALNVVTSQLLDLGCDLGIQQRMIHYDPCYPHKEAYQAARCVSLRQRTGFELGMTAQALILRGKRTLTLVPSVTAKLRTRFPEHVISEILNYSERGASSFR